MEVRHTLLLCVLLCLCGCKGREQAGNIDGLFGEVILLKHDTVNTGNHLWGTPFDFLCCDSSLFVFDERSEDGLFHWIDLAQTDSVFNFGAKGQGAEEFVFPLDFQCYPPNAITIFDFYRKSLVLLDLESLKKGEVCYKVLVKDTLPGTMKLLPTNAGTFVSLGLYEDGMFKLWGKGIGAAKPFFCYPFKDEEEKAIPNRLRGLAYQGILRMHPAKDKFVFAVKSSEIIYFYKVDGSVISMVNKHEMSYPVYMTESGGDKSAAPMSASNKNTFVSLCCTDKYVYGLYSGKSFKEGGLSSMSGSVIYVFDWEGTAVRKYELDQPSTLICVDGKDEFLYAFANMPDPQLIKFRMPDFSLAPTH